MGALTAIRVETTLPPEPVMRLSVEQYHAMIEQGIIESGSPIELLEGVLVKKMSKKPRHSFVMTLLLKKLEAAIPENWYVRIQDPVTTDDSEPEPDLAVVRGDPRDFSARHPRGAEVGIVIEISDASLHRDRTWKRRIYASGGFNEYWVIDVNENTVEVFTEPNASHEYAQVKLYSKKDRVPVILDGKTIGRIPVKEILP